jgi:hypothetical protein
MNTHVRRWLRVAVLAGVVGLLVGCSPTNSAPSQPAPASKPTTQPIKPPPDDRG